MKRFILSLLLAFCVCYPALAKTKLFTISPRQCGNPLAAPDIYWSLDNWEGTSITILAVAADIFISGGDRNSNLFLYMGIGNSGVPGDMETGEQYFVGYGPFLSGHVEHSFSTLDALPLGPGYHLDVHANCGSSNGAPTWINDGHVWVSYTIP